MEEVEVIKSDPESLYDFIRCKPNMFINPRLETIPGIIENFLLLFASLELERYSISNSENFLLIGNEDEWMNDINDNGIERYFSTFYIDKNLPVNSTRPEILIPAFKYDCFTFGPSGKWGDVKVLNEFQIENPNANLATLTRVLIIKKTQKDGQPD